MRRYHARMAVASAKPAKPASRKASGEIWLGEADYACTQGSGATVDRQANIIRGVKILGLTSQNGRNYLPETLRRALSLYEAAPVYFNHPPKNSTADRPYEDRFGETCNVRLTESGIYGDVKFNPKHPRAEQVLFDIENNTSKVGFSPDHYGDGPMRNGRRIVESISRVKSIDIVANPATNRSFSESEGDHDMELAEQLAESRANETKLTSENAGLKEQLTKLTEQVGALTGEKAALQEQVDAAAAATKAAQHKAKIGELLAEHKVPESARTKEFVALLESSSLEAATGAIKSLAESFKAGNGRPKSDPPASGGKGGSTGDFDPKAFAGRLK